MRTAALAILIAAAALVLGEAEQPGTGGKTLVAHRGASAYAPEHTRAAYELAIAQGADYVEQDLGVTRDGVLVCLHDDSLERTTNVETVFPDRFVQQEGGPRRWMLADFTLAEVKQLDAGSWFHPKFAGERIPTWDEAVQIVGDRAGLFPEMKSPALYRGRGVDVAALVASALKRTGHDGTAAAGRPRVIVQSFDPEALRALAALVPEVPRVLLLDERSAAAWVSDEGLARLRGFAGGIGPAKRILIDRRDVVARARAAGLTVTPYTFRSANTGMFADVAAEMRYFLYDLDVDGVFTDNPDQFPRRRP